MSVWTAVRASRFRHGSPTLFGSCAPYEAEDDGLGLPQAPIVDCGACSIDSGKPPAPSHLSIAWGRGEEPWLEKRWCCDGSASPRERRGSEMDPRHSAVASLPTRPRMTDFICRRRQLSTAVPGMLTDSACSRTAASGGIIEVAPTGIGTSSTGPIEGPNLGGQPRQRRRLAGAPISSVILDLEATEGSGECRGSIPERRRKHRNAAEQASTQQLQSAQKPRLQPPQHRSTNVIAPPEGHMRHMS